MSEWLEMRCRVPAKDYLRLEAALEKLGASAITTSEGDSEIFGEPGVSNDHEWQIFTLTALFERGESSFTSPSPLLKELNKLIKSKTG